MTLTMNERRSITKETRAKYQKATKKQKMEMLNWFVELTKYNRCYAARILRAREKARVLGSIKVGRERIVFVERKKNKHKTKIRRQRVYGDEVASALKKIWAICDGICSKRLAAVLSEIIRVLENFGEIELSAIVREKLAHISPSTIDRLLAPVRKKYELKGRHSTKPGSMLKSQIAVRTFSDWNEERPGFMEFDLVSHDGGNPRGDFIQTLSGVDVCSGWMENEAVKNKAQRWVFGGLEGIRGRLPFDLLGIDSDNGSEFINDHLLRYCDIEEITFTRSRPYRKNDSCYVEQKNYSVVRRTVGYQRYDTDEELETLNELYGYLRLYTNFFLPVMKMKEKTRVGSKVKKIYDEPKTPYQRLLDSDFISKTRKQKLMDIYVKLNPAELKRQISRLQDKLLKLNLLKEEKRRKEVRDNTKDFEYISS